MLTREARVDKPSIKTRLLIEVLGTFGWLLSGANYRFFAAVAKLVARLAPEGTTCAVRIDADTVFKFDLNDFYYNRLISTNYHYEPELERLLSRFKDVDYVFLDCGANFGYWSLKVSGAQLGRKRVVAVEAFEPTFRRLIENRAMNGRAFEVLHRAVAEATGAIVTIYNRGSHAGSSSVEQWLGNTRPIAGTCEVASISIDDIAALAKLAHDTPIVIKLDVEGAEVAALLGARAVLAGNTLVIYEEYGEDTTCRVSRLILDELRMAVFYVGEAGELRRVQRVEDVRQIKQHKTKGYNFAAVSEGSIFQERLLGWLAQES